MRIKQWGLTYGVVLIFIFAIINANLAQASQTEEKTMLNTPTTLLSNYHFPEIHHWTTQKGVNVYFIQSTALPMLDIEVIFDAGSIRNGHQEGLSALTNALLAEGTARFSADELHEQFEAVGAEFESDARKEMALVRLRTLTKPAYLEQALSTFIEVTAKPSFEQGAFERERNNALIALENENQNPARVAGKAFYQLIYGEHPYGAPVLGTKESLLGLTRESIIDFYKTYYVAQNATIAMVGDITLAKAQSIAEELSAPLNEGKAPPSLDAVKQTSGKIERIDFPSEQTHILMGMPGLKRIDNDYFPLVVGNHILGSNGTINRLFQILRNQHGLAYSANSYFLPMHEQGPYILSVQTKKESADKALALLNQTFNDFLEKGPSEEELELAKANLLGGYALRFDSNEALLTHLAMIGFYKLPLDYNETYPLKVNEVSTKDIQAAFKKRFSTQQLFTVMVGPNS